jgi:hypothetical protein
MRVIKSRRMRWACAGFQWGNRKERYHWGEPGVDGRKILRWNFREVGWGGMDWVEMAQDRDRWGHL